MRNHIFTLATLCVGLSGPVAQAVVPEPDAVVYGQGTNPFIPGTVVDARLDLDSSVVASSTIGAIPGAPNGYALRMTLESPTDPGDPRTSGIGRVGDVVSLFVNGADTGDDAMITMRGMIALIDIDVDPDLDGDGHDADVDNCPLIANADQADADTDGLGDVCDDCTDVDEDGFGDPVMAANTCADDNCAGRSNASQSDTDSDGIGDACEAPPTLIVSSDPADLADFATVVDGVGAVEEDDTTILILEGLGPYPEGIVLGSGNSVRIVGVPGSKAVLAGSGTGPTLDVVSTAGLTPIRVEHLIVEGDDGIRATVPTRIVDCEFSSIAGVAIDLISAQHVVSDTQVLSGTTGLSVAAGSTATIDRATFDNLTTGLDVNGSLALTSSLIGDSSTGVAVSPTGNATLDYVTIADSGVAGVDNLGAASISRSVVWGNATDLVGVACGAVQSSDTGSPDCSGVNGNLSVDPQLLGDYHLGAGSPVIDLLDVSSFDGTPCHDLAGGPRLRDGDGDGIVDSDLGAYEELDPAAGPVVATINWSDGQTLSWDPAIGAAQYHVYRGSIATLSYTDYGTCQDVLDGDLTDTTLTDSSEPAGGVGWFYLISAETAGGVEGSTGLGSCVERSRYASCLAPLAPLETDTGVDTLTHDQDGQSAFGQGAWR